MKNKKLLSVILAMTMLFLTAQGILGTAVSASNVVSADSDGVFWLEESDYDTYTNASEGVLSARIGTNGTIAANTTDLVSGGDAYWAWWGSATYTSTYIVDAPSSGTYKLWYRGSTPTNAYYDKSKLKVNGTDITSSLSKVTGTDFTVNVDPSGTKKNFACAFFVAEVTLVSGENTISYEVLEKSTNGSKYACLVDCFVIAPSTYEWASPTISTKPVAPVDTTIHFDALTGVAKFEEYQCDTYSNAGEGVLSARIGTNGTAAANTTDLVSGGDAYWAWWGSATYTSTYKVNAPSAGTYKLWYRGSNPTNAYYDKSKLKVNGTDITSSLSKVTGTDFTVIVDPSGTRKTFACAFFVAEVTLVSGENTISYEVLEKSTTGSKYACLVDCFVIAPSTYEWESPTKDNLPEEVVDTTIHFDALTGVAKFEEYQCDTYSNAGEGVLSARIGTNGTAAANTTDLVSGGDAYWAWWGSATYTSTYIVDAPSAGTYKLWYRGSNPTNAYYDKSKLKVNGTDITSSLSKVTGTDFTVRVDPSGTPKTFACAFFVAEVTLVSGENTISYEVLEKSTNGSKYACLVDCFVIAPSTYEWESPTKDNLPEEVVDTTIHFDALTGVAKFEESDYDTYSNSDLGVLSTRIGTSGTVAANTTDLVSGGDAYWAWWGSGTYTSTYIVDAPSAGTYKLWYRGSNPTNAYYDKSKLKVNGTDITSSLSKVAGTDFTVRVDPSGTPKTFACAFFVAEVTLVSGENTISYEVLEKSTNGSKYACLVDCFVIAPSTYEWASPTKDNLPEPLVLSRYGWIEGENYTRSNSIDKFMSRTQSDMSNGSLFNISTTSAAPAEGYYLEYDFNTYEGTYDIFVRTNHTGGGDNNSPISLSVDGVAKTHTELSFEGWFPSAGSDQFTVGWSKISLPLTAGSHTLRWTVDTMTSTRYFGAVDAVVFMPTSMNLTPQTADIVGTYNEYKLSALLSDYDLTSVSTNLTLPSETIDSDAVTWSTSDASVITSAGAITRNDTYDQTATLTAAITGQSKDFVVKVARLTAYSIENFAFTGSLGSGNTVSVGADVTSLLSGSKNMVLIIAQYSSDGREIKAFGFNRYTLTQNSTQSGNASVTLSDYASGDYVKAFIWDSFDSIIPIADSIQKN